MADFMPAGFYTHKFWPNIKIKLISFKGSIGKFQTNKNSKFLSEINLNEVIHVDPPKDHSEWNVIYDKDE